MEHLILRRAGPQDEAALFAIFGLTQGAHLPGIPEPMRKNLLEMQWRSRCTTYGSIDGNEAWLVTLGPETVASFDVAPGQLVDIRVHPDFQGRGIASKVIHHLQDRFDTLKLNVAFGNPAVALYERCGFQIVDRTPVGLIMAWSRLD